ncbi:ATP-binding protein [Streptomyces sp. PvR034]|uniref:ATP-binding protein n=1 Tax=Streptomyces sp. PvR034 TaxID=3156401 RepID=UPI003391B7F8
MNGARASDDAPAPDQLPASDPLPVSAADARARVRALLPAGSDLDGVSVADALLVTSELVSNAIRHGGGVTGFRAGVAGSLLHLSVTDASPLLPVSRTGTVERPGGYGWPLVQRLAASVECRAHDGGKTIEAVLYLG